MTARNQTPEQAGEKAKAGQAGNARAERLSAALRENLKRRKDQKRERTGGPSGKQDR